MWRLRHLEHGRRSFDVKVSQDFEEGMVQGICRRYSLTWILDQHLFDQVYALLANHSEWVAHEIRLLVLYHLESLPLFLGCEW